MQVTDDNFSVSFIRMGSTTEYIIPRCVFGSNAYCQLKQTLDSWGLLKFIAFFFFNKKGKCVWERENEQDKDES